jgi:hypothetical protein
VQAARADSIPLLKGFVLGLQGQIIKNVLPPFGVSLQLFFQRLAGGELHGLGRRYLDFLAGAGIAALTRFAVHHLKAAETGNGYVIAFLQGRADDGE